MHVTLELLDISRELNVVDLSDMEGSTDGENREHNYDHFGGKPPEDQTKSTDSRLHRSSQLVQRRRASKAQQKFESSYRSGSENDNFLLALLENENKDIFFMMGLVGEIGTELGGRSTVVEAPSGPDANMGE